MPLKAGASMTSLRAAFIGIFTCPLKTHRHLSLKVLYQRTAGLLRRWRP
jgi:hypothetical protein